MTEVPDLLNLCQKRCLEIQSDFDRYYHASKAEIQEIRKFTAEQFLDWKRRQDLADQAQEAGNVANRESAKILMEVQLHG